MAIPNVTEDNTFENWMTVTNILANSIGDLAALSTTTKTSLVSAINEVVSGVVNVTTLNVTGTTSLNGTVNIGDSIGDSVNLYSGTLTLINNVNVSTGLLYLDKTNSKIGFGTSSTPIAGVEITGIQSTSGTYSRYRLAINDNATDAIGVGAGVSFFSLATELVNVRGYKEAVGSSASSAYISTNNGTSLVHRFVITSGGDILSGSNNTQKLGTSANRWAAINATSANIYGTTTLTTGAITAASGLNIQSGKFVVDTTNARIGVNVSPTVPLQVKVDGISQTNWVELAKITNTAGSKGIRLGYSSSTNRAIIASESAGTSSGLEIWTYNSSTSQHEKGFQIDETGVGQFVKSGIQLANFANSGATVLDWYEEGSFYPTLEINGAQSSTFISREGSYTRIGNRVYFNATIKMSSVIGTGTVKIGSLPVVSANVVNRDFACSIQAYNMASSVGNMVAKINENSNKVELAYVSAGSLTTITNAHLASNTVISVSGHYEV